MPASLQSLPPELLQPILSPLPSRALLSAALVSHQWAAFALPLLYRRIAIYTWHAGKARAASLMHTLSTRPDLARWVRYLDIKDIPKDFAPSQEDEKDRMYEDCEKGLAACINLETCIWTRHATLTPAILRTLSSLPHLIHLELNASCVSYEPSDLLHFRRLRALGLTMPDRKAVSVLERWLAVIDAEAGDDLEGVLQSLSIICQSTPHITSALLASLAPYLSHLSSFSLLGCPKVDQTGLIPLLLSAGPNLTSLSFESLSPTLDLVALARSTSRSLTSLQSLSISLPTSPLQHPSFLAALLNFTSESSLASLTLSLPPTYNPPSTSLVLYDPNAAQAPASTNPELPPYFVRALALAHGRTLLKFAVSRLPVPLETLESVCAHFPLLETLIVLVHDIDWPRLTAAITALTRLRTLHLSFPSSVSHNASLPALASFARALPQLEQVGHLSKVYKVVRTWVPAQHGAEVTLEPWAGPPFPEAFQVIRA